MAVPRKLKGLGILYLIFNIMIYDLRYKPEQTKGGL